MSEETNLIMDDGSDLFVDEPTSEPEQEESIEPTEEPTGGEAQEETPEGEPTEPQEEPQAAPKEASQTLKVKYNGVEQEIPIDEAVQLVQKGMNYDKAIERERNNSREIKILDEYAKLNNMTRSEYLEFLDSQKVIGLERTKAQELQAQHPDWPDDVIKTMSKLLAKDAQKEQEEKERQRQEQEQQEQIKPWTEFAAAYPQYKKIEDLPKPVLDDVATGATPLQAMLKFELAEKERKIEELNQKLETERTNQKNKGKAVGSVSTTANKTQSDDFLSGLGF